MTLSVTWCKHTILENNVYKIEIFKVVFVDKHAFYNIKLLEYLISHDFKSSIIFPGFSFANKKRGVRG